MDFDTSYELWKVENKLKEWVEDSGYKSGFDMEFMQGIRCYLATFIFEIHMFDQRTEAVKKKKDTDLLKKLDRMIDSCTEIELAMTSHENPIFHGWHRDEKGNEAKNSALTLKNYLIDKKLEIRRGLSVGDIREDKYSGRKNKNRVDIRQDFTNSLARYYIKTTGNNDIVRTREEVAAQEESRFRQLLGICFLSLGERVEEAALSRLITTAQKKENNSKK